MTTEPSSEVVLPASASGPRVVFAVFDSFDAPESVAPSVFALIHAPTRPGSDAIARMLLEHVAPGLDALGLVELAAQLRTLAVQPNAIFATGGPVPAHIGEPDESVLFVQLYRGAR